MADDCADCRRLQIRIDYLEDRARADSDIADKEINERDADLTALRNQLDTEKEIQEASRRSRYALYQYAIGKGSADAPMGSLDIEIRDVLTATRALLGRCVESLRYVERHCPCGARSESQFTHSHVNGCPVGDALTAVESSRCQKHVEILAAVRAAQEKK